MTLDVSRGQLNSAYPKWDGYRAEAGRWADGRVTVRSPNGSDLSGAFPEIEEAVRRLPDDTALDCELIVWEAGRLAFERLQQRMHRRSAAAARAAVEFPAHLVAFDLLRVHSADLTGGVTTPRVSTSASIRRPTSGNSPSLLDHKTVLRTHCTGELRTSRLPLSPRSARQRIRP
ncbi:hypothetical protein [Streptomyces sp. NPDC001536]|uniref:ATP-dependent DNA ligase n=1 Tax=Streptomyces sp. NPDC001536 TaxID=3364583 RepID=UPI00369BBABB